MIEPAPALTLDLLLRAAERIDPLARAVGPGCAVQYVVVAETPDRRSWRVVVETA